MPRDIFYTGELRNVTQGCVFFGGIADGIEHPVHGVIITPRCNIAQNKVATLHYLPISNFKDWKRLHLAAIYQFEEMKSRKNNLKPLLLSKGIDEPVIEESILNGSMSIPDEALEKILSEKGLKETKIEEVKSYRRLYDLSHCHSELRNWSKLNSRISELISGKMEKFLLLDSHDSEDDRFFVIHLTEIRHLRVETARTLLRHGIRGDMVDSENDDLYRDESRTSGIYRIKYSLTSPYVDYVCQHLANAFFRIGIEDFDGKAVSEKLKSMIAE